MREGYSAVRTYGATDEEREGVAADVAHASLSAIDGGDRRWESEELLFDGDTFFARLAKAIDSARTSIDMEYYIFAVDAAGELIADRLAAAARRGVKVRLVVDGIGSAGTMAQFGPRLRAAGVRYRVFHQLPWERWSDAIDLLRRLSRAMRYFGRVNLRNHRKVAIFDGCEAWVGGINISDVYLSAVHGAKAWRDSVVIVRGAGVSDLLLAFNHHWLGRRGRAAYWLKHRGRYFAQLRSPLVRLNATRTLRRAHYLDLLRRIRHAERRVWITNSYFLPHRAFMRALRSAARRGVDVRVMLPRESDVVFMPWVTTLMYPSLLNAGVRIFEYLPAMLHAKTMMVDDWAVIGSSNLNHRSLLHDLEADIVLSKPESYAELEQEFLRNSGFCDELAVDARNPFCWWKRGIGRVCLAVRYVL